MPAKSGEQAIQLFKKDQPDLVILDVVMEGMSGFDCATKLRSINAEDWIPIIFLSASVNDVNIEKGINAGGDDYLTKPFSEINLAAKIKAMQCISSMRKKLYNTGMGNDGAEGLLSLKQAHGHTLIQDPMSTVVFGMAGVAQAMGGVDKVIE